VFSTPLHPFFATLVVIDNLVDLSYNTPWGISSGFDVTFNKCMPTANNGLEGDSSTYEDAFYSVRRVSDTDWDLTISVHGTSLHLLLSTPLSSSVKLKLIIPGCFRITIPKWTARLWEDIKECPVNPTEGGEVMTDLLFNECVDGGALGIGYYLLYIHTGGEGGEFYAFVSQCDATCTVCQNTWDIVMPTDCKCDTTRGGCILLGFESGGTVTSLGLMAMGLVFLGRFLI
jgi:hypothetical protein